MGGENRGNIQENTQDVLNPEEARVQLDPPTARGPGAGGKSHPRPDDSTPGSHPGWKR